MQYLYLILVPAPLPFPLYKTTINNHHLVTSCDRISKMSEEKNIPEEKSEDKNSNPDSNRDENVQEHFPEDSHAPHPVTSNQQQETKDMEVHHHSHTPRKKWTHYFWEFLMLFLAVFCGFLAENQREHMVEHQREKKFIKSLVSDLEVETARLNDILLQRHRREGMLDSFVTLLNKQDAATYGRYLYYFNSFATRGPAFRYTPVDGTMQQLKMRATSG